MIAEIREYLEKPSHSGKRYLIKKNSWYKR